MRVNVYAEEMTDRVELVTKSTVGGPFIGVRFYLELPVSDGAITVKGPFRHHPDDDDSSAVTFWGKRDLRKVLEKALSLLDKQPKEGQPKEVQGTNFALTPHHEFDSTFCTRCGIPRVLVQDGFVTEYCIGRPLYGMLTGTR